MSKKSSYFVPDQPGQKPTREPSLVRVASGPIRERKSGAGAHAQGVRGERTKGGARRAAISRSLDGNL